MMIPKIKISSLKIVLLMILITFGNLSHAEYYLVFSASPCNGYKDFDYRGERHWVAPRHKHHHKRHHYHSYKTPCRIYTCHETCHYCRPCYARYQVYTQRYIADVDNPYYDYADGATGDDDPACYPDLQVTNPPY